MTNGLESWRRGVRVYTEGAHLVRVLFLAGRTTPRLYSPFHSLLREFQVILDVTKDIFTTMNRLQAEKRWRVVLVRPNRLESVNVFNCLQFRVL